MNLLIVHPDGNINENPNLWGIVEILTRRGYVVDIVSPKNRPHQLSPAQGSRMLRYSADHAQLVGAGDAPETLRERYEWVIGVDQGMLTAAALAGLTRARLGFISYEISFGDEVGEEIKFIERLACSRAEFAVSQDPLRSAHLAREYGLAPGRIIQIPLAGCGPARPGRGDSLKRDLGLGPESRVLLFLGSVSRWTLADRLAEASAGLPEGWVLVMHNRYGLTGYAAEVAARVAGGRTLFFGDAMATLGELEGLLHGADMGVVMYASSADHMNTGRNVADVGMASGKFAMMMRYGLPVVVNELGAMTEAVRSLGLGIVAATPEDVGSALATVSPGALESMRGRCCRYFEESLDLDGTVGPLLEALESDRGPAVGSFEAADQALLLLEAQRVFLGRKANANARARHEAAGAGGKPGR